MPHSNSVLVVDDVADTRELLSVALELAGYGVLLAQSGVDAIALARTHRPAVEGLDAMCPKPCTPDALIDLLGQTPRAKVSPSPCAVGRGSAGLKARR